MASTTARSSVTRKQPWYGERELRYLKDYLEGLLDYSMGRAPTKREAGFQAWMREGVDWIAEDRTGGLSLERPAVRSSNGKRPQLKERPVVAHQLRLVEDGTDDA